MGCGRGLWGCGARGRRDERDFAVAVAAAEECVPWPGALEVFAGDAASAIMMRGGARKGTACSLMRKLGYLLQVAGHDYDLSCVVHCRVGDDGVRPMERDVRRRSLAGLLGLVKRL